MWSRADAPVAAIVLAVFGMGCHSGTTSTPTPSGALAPPQPPAELMQAITDGDRAAVAALPAGPARAQIEGSCTTCHGVAMIEQQHKDSAGWSKTLGQMRAWGAPVPDDQVPAVISYLVLHYGP